MANRARLEKFVNYELSSYLGRTLREKLNSSSNYWFGVSSNQISPNESRLIHFAAKQQAGTDPAEFLDVMIPFDQTYEAQALHRDDLHNQILQIIQSDILNRYPRLVSTVSGYELKYEENGLVSLATYVIIALADGFN